MTKASGRRIMAVLSVLSLAMTTALHAQERVSGTPYPVEEGAILEEGPVLADPAWDVDRINPCLECTPGKRLAAGFEFALLQPRFSNNVAFTVEDSDGVTFARRSAGEFDYDLEVSPRVWVEFTRPDDTGLRVTWWQFDHTADMLSASPPDAFGEVALPTFAGVTLSTDDPNDTVSASTNLNAYTIDLEGTKFVDFKNWWLSMGAGLRFASIDQQYTATVPGATGGEVEFIHRDQGIGPTLSASVARPWGHHLTFFGMARGSLLFGDGESELVVSENFDPNNPFVTRESASRDDAFAVTDLQVGVEWHPHLHFHRFWQPFMHVAMEGQFWNDVGSGTSEEGTIGFYGFNVAVGFVH